MSNFSDDEDLRPRVLAEARKEDWSDDDDEDGVEAGMIAPAESQAGDYPRWGDDETGQSDGETEEEPTAGAIFGSKTDPIGDLRTKAKNMNRAALDAVDKYVKRAADEAKKVRTARKKISALRDQSLKAFQRAEKRKDLSDSAKDAQRAQHGDFTAPRTGELARIDAQLAAQEDWLNALLKQRELPVAAASKASGKPEVVKGTIGPGNSTQEKSVDRHATMHLQAGMEIAWNNGVDEKHQAGPYGNLYSLQPGTKYTVTNRSPRTAESTLLLH